MDTVNIPASYVGLVGFAATVVSALIGLVKPLIELIPGLHATDKAHDPAIRLLSLFLNFGVALALGYGTGTFAHLALGPTLILLAIQSVLQSGMSELSYQLIGTRTDTSTAPTPALPPTK